MFEPLLSPMYLKKLMLGAGLALASLSGLCAASAGSWQSWMNQYYQNPQPERIVSAAFGLAHENAFDNAEFASTAVGFFGQVFRDHPDRVDAWFRNFDELPAAAQRTMAAALWYSGHPRGQAVLSRLARNSDHRETIERLAASEPPALEATPVLSESSMNLQWGAFLASGDAAHVQQILAAVGRDAVGGAARTALAVNAARHDRVLEICRNELNRQPNEVRSVLRAVINDAEQNQVPRT